MMNHERAGTRRSPLPWSHLIYAVVFVGLVVGGLYCGYVAYAKIRQFAASTQFKSIPIAPASDVQPHGDPEQSVPSQDLQPQPEQQAQTPQKSVVYPDIEHQERVNILFLGIDQRPGESTACRTDTMILVSVNPRDMSLGLLSIPRDLWVPIRHPKHPENRINTAHYWGEVENYPGGGPELAKDTVEYNFGVPVHYYVRLNFTGFERIIDMIGGIDIYVPYTIDDYQYPNGSNGTEHLYIEAGQHHFDGEMALKYARTRKGTGDGDFSRMDRQQQVILAVRDTVLSLEKLPQRIVQLPEIYRSLGDSVETDIPFDMMFTLAEWALQIDTQSILMETIDRRMTTDRTTSKGDQVLEYDRQKARPIIEALFGDPTPEAQATETSHLGKLEAEQARVAVLNGTNETGLAASVDSFLKMQGIDVVLVDNADRSDYEHTVVRIYGEKPATVQWLVNWLIDIGVPEPVVEHQVVESDAEIVIVLGKDFPAEKMKG